ncbi:hypothetical protein MCOR03_007420 [Pyricularia oryzae]|uniref:DUF7136 domain-containing protein n=1 Tax=Pyricularia grisea TaxID=148305 RepID=A0ABQ8NKA2_PYRGI|nr:hypothetical protein MCOR26_009492 [Pyricularia oryzae]KAI6298411.1 hypothetical protein MCOR33_005484 [Pyricularia grisea]KAI6307453.1 hypothetical protein MCOR34_007597 [Pyricularia oryzae]KAI6334305.1 hypothetical protein MCOR28_010088 [Pyricularia oryzae]KAI6335886.1 hypothetical protein MCOR30_003671 [Pyricularia oryzae]
MRLILIFTFVSYLLGSFVKAQPNLPADVQVDLIFPVANQTYAPTEWFPIVFAFRNLDKISMNALNISLGINSRSEGAWMSKNTRNSWWNQIDSIQGEDWAKMKMPPPGTPFIYTAPISILNMTNGTDTIHVSWYMRLDERCFLNGSDPRYDLRTGLGGMDAVGGIEFHSAPGGQTLSIEKTLSSCRHLDHKTSFPFRVLDEKKSDWKGGHNQDKLVTPGGRPCSIVETGIPRIGCTYEPFAKEIAANVSRDIWARTRCTDGLWSYDRESCFEISLGLVCNLGLGMVWLFALSCTFIVTLW